MNNYFLAICLLLMTGGMNSCKKKDAGNRQFPLPDWKTDNTGKYSFSMTAVVQLPPSLQAGVQSQDKVAAFIKGECRGIGVPVNVQGSSQVYYVLIHCSSSEQEKIKFWYYNTKTSYMYTTTDFLDLNVDGNFGTTDTPEILDLQPVK